MKIAYESVRALVLCAVGLLLGITTTAAQTITWAGGYVETRYLINTTYYFDVATATNWTGGSFLGSGLDDVTFADLGSENAANANVFVSADSALRNITFTNSATTYDFRGDNTISSLLINGNVTMSSAGDAKLHSSFSIGLSTGNHTVDIASGGQLEVETSIADYAGASGIVKTGAGTLALSGSNSFTGGVTLNGGWLLVGDDNALGSNTGAVTLNSGTLSTVYTDPLNPVTFTLSNPITITGGIKLGDCDTHNGITFSGQISGTGAFDTHGYGTIGFGASNSSWTGGISFYGDNAVNVTNPNGLGTGAVWFNSDYNSTHVYFNTSASIGTLSGGYRPSGDAVDGGAIHLLPDVVLTINQASDGEYDGAIHGTLPRTGELPSNADGGILKTGAGKLTLGGTTDYYGPTRINAGTLADGADLAFSPSSTYRVSSGSGATLLVNYDETIGGIADGDGAGAVNLGTAGKTLTISNAANNTFSGTITGPGELTKAGGGSLTLSGTNTFTGDFYVGGPVILDNNAAAGQGVLEMGSSANLSFTTNAATPTLYGLSASSPTDTIDLTNVTALTINQASNTDFQGQFTNGTGTAITKTGSGTLTFSHSNAYTGTTTISGGTLVFGATGAFGTGSVTVDGGKLGVANGVTFTNPLNFGVSGGLLGGTGTFAGPLTLGSGVVVSPGNSPGTLNFTGDLTLNNGFRYDWQVQGVTGTAGTDWDLINVSGTPGTLTLANSSTFTLKVMSLNLAGAAGQLNGIVPFSTTQWTIFTTTGGVINPGNLANFTIDTTGFTSDVGGSFSLGLSGNNVVLNFTAVPEPSTYALMALGLATTGLAAWRRRRRV